MKRPRSRPPTTTWRPPIAWLALLLWIVSLHAAPVLAQPSDASTTLPAASGQLYSDEEAGAASSQLGEKLEQAERLAERAVLEGPSAPAGEPPSPPLIQAPARLTLLELLVWGGPIMVPIGIVSLITVAVAAERFLALRRRNVLPRDLMAALEQAANQSEGFDPRETYQLCGQRRSAAGKVIQAMLLKVGRPQSELEHAITQASERESAELYSNVRWLNLAAAVAPLLGLLGTVWGMILAFFKTVNLPVGVNKAQCLADGIWQALVTTLAGLTVAIPAAILAHYFEGRIQRLIRDLDEALHNVLPQLERYEGRLHLSKEQLEQPQSPPISAAAGADAAREARRKKPAVSPK